VLLAAAGWQFTPHKRRWLREGHLSRPPTRTALSFGARSGLACLGSCWCLMLLMNVAPGAGLLGCLLVSGIATTERLLSQPARATRLAGVGLGIAGLWTLILGIG
jgi:predicted metal-binding membrane protein